MNHSVYQEYTTYSEMEMHCKLQQKLSTEMEKE